MSIAYAEMLRQAIERKTVDETVKKLTDMKVDPEWIEATLAELGYNKPKTIAHE